jgi:hypothetical protein
MLGHFLVAGQNTKAGMVTVTKEKAIHGQEIQVCLIMSLYGSKQAGICPSPKPT